MMPPIGKPRPELQDDLEKLQRTVEAFRNTYADTTQRLIEALGTFSERATGEQIRSPGLGSSPYSSTPQRVAQLMGQGGQILNAAAPGSGLSPSASVAPPNRGGGGQNASVWNLWGRGHSLWGAAYSGPFLNEYERGQIRLGNFEGEGISRALMVGSWLAGHGADWGAPITQEQYNALPPDIQAQYIQSEDQQSYYNPAEFSTAARLSTGLGALGQTATQVPRIWSQLTRAPIIGSLAQMGLGFFQPNRYVLQGQQAGGFSRTGGLIGGIPFLSPAALHGLGMSWRAGLQSWFGMNPNYSFGQAQEAQNAIASAGYWGNDANFLANQARSLFQNAQLNPQEVIGLYDPLMRYGGSTQELALQLNALAQSAKAAHLGLTQFGQDLTSTSQQITGQTGMLSPAGSLEALAAGTRTSPSALSGLYSNQNLIMGAAISGQSLGQLMFSPTSQRTTAAMALPMRMWGALTGNMTFQQFRQLPSSQQNTIKTRLAYAYMSNPQIFGGLSPTQMFDQWAKGIDFTKRMQGYQDLQTAVTRGQFDTAIKEFGGPAATQLQKEFTQKFGSGAFNQGQARQDILNKMTKYLDQQNNKAASQVTVTLDPWARKLVKIKDSTNSTNKGDSGWRTAIHVGSDIVGGVAGFGLGGPAGAALGVGIANTLSDLIP